jgi:segregation and condensation protein A
MATCVWGFSEFAIRVRVSGFEGPLDLLLHLVRINEISIADIPIVEITAQYNAYLDLMRELNLEVAGEYLVMAATLMHIKSRMLLPVEPLAGGERPADPRAELAQQIAHARRFQLEDAEGPGLAEAANNRTKEVGAEVNELKYRLERLEVRRMLDFVSAEKYSAAKEELLKTARALKELDKVARKKEERKKMHISRRGLLKTMAAIGGSLAMSLPRKRQLMSILSVGPIVTVA